MILSRPRFGVPVAWSVEKRTTREGDSREQAYGAALYTWKLATTAVKGSRIGIGTGIRFEARSLGEALAGGAMKTEWVEKVEAVIREHERRVAAFDRQECIVKWGIIVLGILSVLV